MAATTDEVLADMPTPQAVIAAISGPDAAATLGRQCQVLMELARITRGPLLPYTASQQPQTQARSQAYMDAVTPLRQQYESQYQAASGPAWRERCAGTAVSRAEILALLGPVAMASLRANNAEAAALNDSQNAELVARNTRIEAARERDASLNMKTAARKSVGVLAGVAVLVAGILAWLASLRMNKGLLRYEFENRGEGGVVGFKDFDASIAHERRRGLARMLYVAAQVIVVLGIGLIIAFAAN
jgi:hypothetical protein